jgi:hypothetical protein
LKVGSKREGKIPMTKEILMPPGMRITWEVLEAARDVGDEVVIAACRRIIAANRLGWRKHGDRPDLRLVLEFAD